MRLVRAVGSLLIATCAFSVPAYPVSTPDMLTASQLGFHNKLGEQIFLNGINVRVRSLFDVSFDDGRQPIEDIPELHDEDLHQMTEQGFNFVRLPVSWSAIEPAPGKYNENYLRELDRNIELFNNAGMLVLIDSHQDGYSKEIGEDGAPYWALHPKPIFKNTRPLTPKSLILKRLSPVALLNFGTFFKGKHGVQAAYLEMLGHLAARYKNHPGVLGIEVFNEPVVSHIPRRGEDLLYSFYQRACDKIRSTGFDKSIWIQPSAIHLFRKRHIPQRSLNCSHLVYAPHFYPSFMGFHGGTSIKLWEAFIREAFEAMAKEAKDLKAPLVIGELGIDPHQVGYAEFAEALYRVSAELRLAGHAKWLWKERSQDNWGFFDWDRLAVKWIFRHTFAESVMRPMLLATSAHLGKLQYGDYGMSISLIPRLADESLRFFHRASENIEISVDGTEQNSQPTASPNIHQLNLIGLTPGKAVEIAIRPRTP